MALPVKSSPLHSVLFHPVFLVLKARLRNVHSHICTMRVIQKHCFLHQVLVLLGIIWTFDEVRQTLCMSRTVLPVLWQIFTLFQNLVSFLHSQHFKTSKVHFQHVFSEKFASWLCFLLRCLIFCLFYKTALLLSFM